ncbi:MAG: hypothetical protein J6Y36_00950 [Treponema sp.]|uniref:hypothetical protein n=1 Tax=Treponema sp. TaxID=166 RepID=UPI001B659D85|nr:hypothetical protein [Treponema sp.]MBP5401704.1 hypothetical protein [Treponema sp.]MBR5933613.1 hypothetical protein [Treponema sp.]
MLKKIFILFIFLSCASAFADSPFRVPLKTDGLMLVFTNANYNDENYFTDDVELIKEIAKDWKFYIPSFYNKETYDYNGYLIQNGEVLSSVLINLEAGEITTDKGTYAFSTGKFEKIQSRFKKVKLKSYSFKTVEEANETYAGVLKNPKIILVEYERWQEFDGYFYIFIADDNFSKSSKIEKEIISFIKKEYPEYNVDVRLSVYNSETGFTFSIECNQDFYNVFDAYAKSEFKFYDRLTMKAFFKE